MTNGFYELMNSSRFVRTLMIATSPIYARHIKELSTNRFQDDFLSYGTTKEVHLKTIAAQLGSFQHYFEDLEKSLIFLNVEKRKIVTLYSKAIRAEEYFKYHYDNFVVRVVTSMDICGKIGDTICELGIPVRYQNAFSYINHPEVKNSDSAVVLNDLATYLEHLRTQRHSKVHGGQNESNRFDTVLFIEDLNEALGTEEPDNVLDEYGKEQIREANKEIEDVILKVAGHVIKFLDSLTVKLSEIIERK
jgi:hypothetical protein